MRDEHTPLERVFHFVAWCGLTCAAAMILCQIIIWLER